MCNVTFSFFGVSNSLFIRLRAGPRAETDTRNLFFVVAGKLNTIVKKCTDKTMISTFSMCRGKVLTDHG